MCMLIFFFGGGGLLSERFFGLRLGSGLYSGGRFFGRGGGGWGGYRKFTAYHHNVGLSIVPVAIIL